MGLCILENFNAVDAHISQFPDSHVADLVNLFHLQWRIIPGSGAKASGKLQSISNRDRILQMDLAINNATDETIEMLEDDGLILLKLNFMFGKLFIVREIHTTKLSLD